MGDIDFLGRLRVVRHFLTKPVAAEDLAAILEVGRWTGSAKNSQRWQMLVITEPAGLGRLADCGNFTNPIRNATAVIAPIGLAGSYEWDLGRLSQNLMLAAAARGVGSCPVTLHNTDLARSTLELGEGEHCRVVIALGYPDLEREGPARAASMMKGRKPLDDLVVYERR